MPQARIKIHLTSLRNGTRGPKVGCPFAAQCPEGEGHQSAGSVCALHDPRYLLRRIGGVFYARGNKRRPFESQRRAARADSAYYSPAASLAPARANAVPPTECVGKTDTQLEKITGFLRAARIQPAGTGRRKGTITAQRIERFGALIFPERT